MHAGDHFSVPDFLAVVMAGGVVLCSGQGMRIVRIGFAEEEPVWL